MMKKLSPHEFLPEHLEYINKYADSIKFLSIHNHAIIIGLKDINSRYLVTSDAHAKTVGMKCASDMIGLTDDAMQCIDTSKSATQYQSEDQQVINNTNPSSKYSYLKVHNYATGFKAILINKYLMYHKESNSVLGVAFSGHEISFLRIFNFIPNYANLVMKAKYRKAQLLKEEYVVNNVKLTQYEYEVAYLLSLDWSLGQIADFMNNRDVGVSTRNQDTIKKVKNTIGKKIAANTQMAFLKDKLISLNVHLYPPKSIQGLFLGIHILSSCTG